MGLLVGIMSCILLFYFDFKFFEATRPDCKKKEIVTHIQTDTVYVEVAKKFKKQNITAESEVTDTEISNETSDGTSPNEEESVYNAEFSLDDEPQDEVFAEKLLKTKTVKVIVLHPEKQDADNYFRFFEIQQWNTPIRNRIAYYRDQNMLKIKGIEIDKANIVLLNGVYYLEIGNRYYNIPETNVFEKLNVTNITQ